MYSFIHPVALTAPSGVVIIGQQYAYRKDAARQIDEQHRELRREKLEQVERDFGELLLRTLSEGTSMSEVTRLTGASRNTLYEIRDRAISLRGSMGSNLMPTAESVAAAVRR